MRVIQLVKSGFYTGRENFLNHKAKEMWPVIPEKHHVHKIEPRNPDFKNDLRNLIVKSLILKKNQKNHSQISYKWYITGFVRLQIHNSDTSPIETTCISV